MCLSASRSWVVHPNRQVITLVAAMMIQQLLLALLQSPLSNPLQREVTSLYGKACCQTAD
jgi:hypothetical protein